jgi:hypothetical protein
MKRTLFFIACGALLFAPRAHAGKLLPAAVDDMFAGSGAVVLGTVTNIDEHHGERTGYPSTAFTISVEEVLSGSLDTGEGAQELVLVQRGGYLSDDSVLSFSANTELRQGTSYVLFLRDSFYISPFLRAQDGVIERVDLDGRSAAANRAGQLVRLSKMFGLQHLSLATNEDARAAASNWDDVLAYLRERAAVAEASGVGEGMAASTPRELPVDQSPDTFNTPYDASLLARDESPTDETPPEDNTCDDSYFEATDE